MLYAVGVCLAAALGASGASDGPAADPLEPIRSLIRTGRYADAEKEARARLAVVESLNGPGSIEAADVLDLVVESRFKAGTAGDPEIRALAERAVRINETLRPHGQELATSLNNLGNVHILAGDYITARSVHERCMALRQELFGPESAEAARSLNNLGVVEHYLGNYEQERSLTERSLAIIEKIKGPDDPAVVEALSNLSTTLLKMGDSSGALAVSRRAEEVARRAYGPAHPRLGQILSNRGITLRILGDYAGARHAYEQALAIKEQSLGPESPIVGKTLDSLGTLLIFTGDYSAARLTLERSLAIQEKVYGPGSVELESALEALAEVASQTGEYAAAQTLLERNLAIIEKAFGPDHHDAAKVFASLGDLRKLQGDLTGAEPFLERSLSIEEKVHGPDHYDVADHLQGIGELRVAQGDDAGARPMYERALSILERSFGADHIRVAEVLNLLAKIDMRSGRYEEALRGALRSEEITRRQFQVTAQSLSEREALAYERIRSSALDVLLSILAATGSASRPDSRRAVWDELMRSRAMVLDEMAARHRASREGSDSDRDALERELRFSRTRLSRVVVRGPDPERPEKYRSELKKAQDEEERAERVFAEKSIHFREEQARGRVGLGDLKRALPARTALVSFAEYDRIARRIEGEDRPSSPARPVRSYIAFVLKAGSGGVETVSLGSASSIDALVDRWKEAAASDPGGLPVGGGPVESQYRQVGTSLRQAIWDPIERRIGHAGQVFLVPDGALNLVSFASLPVGADRYLVESGPLVHYLSSERDLLLGGPAHRPGRGLLALGGPDYDHPEEQPGPAAQVAGMSARKSPADSGTEVYRGPRAGCGDFRSLRFDPLPAAGLEAHEVAAVWNRWSRSGSDGAKVLVLTGPAAEEGDFKRSAAGRRVIHLATHGFFVQGRCASALQSARSQADHDERFASDRSEAQGENPLLLTGLALAGANRRDEVTSEEGEDGILTAEEIASLDLSGVEWAVLSACETGVGQVQAGEGVLGLRRAFETAGAGTLIMSLWSVEDSAAREWMRHLYEGRLGGLTTAEAVRRASLKMIETRRKKGESTHPFYWGAFVAAGDWR